MNWVFPDRAQRLENLDADCYDIGLGKRELHRSCQFDFRGNLICVDWSQFTQLNGGRADYGQLGSEVSSPLPGGGTRIVWGPAATNTDACGGLAYKTGKVVAGQRWGLAAYANTPRFATGALTYLGTFRPVDQWQGVPE